MLFSNNTGFWLRHRGFRFLPLLLATLLLLFLGPVVEVLQFGSKTPFVLLFVVMLAAIETVNTPRRVVIGCYALAAMELVLVFSFELSAHPVIQTVFTITLLGFALAVPVAMIVHIMRQTEVTADLILGALCSYLLLGILFAIVFKLSSEFFPGAFRVSVACLQSACRHLPISASPPCPHWGMAISFRSSPANSATGDT